MKIEKIWWIGMECFSAGLLGPYNYSDMQLSQQYDWTGIDKVKSNTRAGLK